MSTPRPAPFTTEESLLDFLSTSGISFERFTHPPVYTCEQAAAHVPVEWTSRDGAQRGALATKNLFLRSEQGSLYLLMTGCDRRVNFKALARALGVGKLQLASSEQLGEALGLAPGAVTVLALANDPDGRVALLVDEDLWPSPAYQCHPLVNTATLVLSHEALLRFLELTGHPAQAVPTAQLG